MFENAGTPDGRYLIMVDAPKAFDLPLPTGFDEPSYAVLLEVATGSSRRMAELAAPSSQMLSASSDGEWVAWEEATDQYPFLDWRLRAYSLATGEVKEIARATRQDGQPVAGPLSFVTVSHGLAVWGQAVGDGAGPGKMENAVVREADLASGKVRTLATSAGNPWLSWPWLAWVVVVGTGGYTKVTNLETGFESRLEVTAPQFVLDGASAVYNDPESLSIWLIDDLSAGAAPDEIALGAHSADHLEWPTLNDRIVAWAQSLSTVVYDRAERRLVTIPMPQGQRSAVTVAGPLMVWAQRDPGTSIYSVSPDWLMVVDTRKLSVRF